MHSPDAGVRRADAAPGMPHAAGPPQEARQERAPPTQTPRRLQTVCDTPPSTIEAWSAAQGLEHCGLGVPTPARSHGGAGQAERPSHTSRRLGARSRGALSGEQQQRGGRYPCGRVCTGSGRLIAPCSGSGCWLGRGKAAQTPPAGMARHPTLRSLPPLPLAPLAGRARVLDLPRQPGAAHLPLQVPSVRCRRRRRVRALGPSGCTCRPRFECLRPAQPAQAVLCCRTAHPRCLARWQLQSAGSR